MGGMTEDTTPTAETPPPKLCARGCGRPIPPGPGGQAKHDAEFHPEVFKELSKKGVASRRAKAAAKAAAKAEAKAQAKGNGADPEDSHKLKDRSPAAVKTTDHRQANYWVYMPKKFEFSSGLLGLAKQVSMEAWGWPDYDMADGTFIDTFIFHMLQLCGIQVKSWQRIPPPNADAEEEAEEDGNGQGEIAALQSSVQQLAAAMNQQGQKFDTLLNLIATAAANSKGGG